MKFEGQEKHLNFGFVLLRQFAPCLSCIIPVLATNDHDEVTNRQVVDLIDGGVTDPSRSRDQVREGQGREKTTRFNSVLLPLSREEWKDRGWREPPD
jgi:hypothetical protein